MEAAARDINAQMARLGAAAVSSNTTQFTTDEYDAENPCRLPEPEGWRAGGNN